jgi:hypothetical protein
MRTKFFAHFSAVSICMVAWASASVMAEEQSASDLISLAPVISSSDKRYRSIEIEGSLKERGGAHLTFRSIYRAPDQYALFIKDGADDTPLLIATDRKMLIYDPVRPVVLFSDNVYIRSTLRQEGRTCSCFWNWGDVEPSSVLLDIESLYAEPAKNDEVIKTGDKKYRLTSTSDKGNALIADVDLAQSCPYIHLYFVMRDSDGPFLSISKIIVNGVLNDKEFAFPSKANLIRNIAVKDWPSGGALLKDLNGMTLMTKAACVRMAASQPELRQSINLPGLFTTDWERIRRNDEKFSQVLRDLLSPGRMKP